MSSRKNDSAQNGSVAIDSFENGVTTNGRAVARMRTRRFAVVLTASLIGCAPLVGGTAFAATTTTVGDSQIAPCPNQGSNPFCKSLANGGSLSVVTAGASDPKPTLGTGYMRIGTPGVNDKAQAFAVQFANRKLADISDLEYQTYIEQTGSDPRQAPAINIPVNPNKAGKTFTTLVWEPVYAGTVESGKWQAWSPATTPSGHGGWWASGTNPVTDQPNIYGFKSYTASFADVKAALPDAVVIGGVGVNQGSGNTGLRADVDQLKINDTTFDFDNPVVPTSIAARDGDKQTATVNTAFAKPLSVTLTGANQAPASNQDVTFTVTKGSASFDGPTTVKTGANGVATSPTLRAGGTAGPVEVTAKSGTLTTTFTETVVPNEADLSVTTAAPPTVAAGSSFTVTLTARNAGPVTATQVTTSMTVPAGLTITAAPGGTRSARAATFSAPSIAAGASATYTVTVTADSATRGTQTINAMVNGQPTDPNSGNNTTQTRVTVR